MNLTRWIIVTLIAFIVAIDFVLIGLYGLDATISVQITKWSHEYLIIPFAFGMLMSHFFVSYTLPPDRRAP